MVSSCSAQLELIPAYGEIADLKIKQLWWLLIRRKPKTTPAFELLAGLEREVVRIGLKKHLKYARNSPACPVATALLSVVKDLSTTPSLRRAEVPVVECFHCVLSQREECKCPTSLC